MLNLTLLRLIRTIIITPVFEEFVFRFWLNRKKLIYHNISFFLFLLGLILIIIPNIFGLELFIPELIIINTLLFLLSVESDSFQTISNIYTIIPTLIG
ncbi:hypothetical protein HC864_04015 [Candidatus Gracilibacteria bacterium]|nr:hypothetical protein [Candidatus Gracilibacteria bacterium]